MILAREVPLDNPREKVAKSRQENINIEGSERKLKTPLIPAGIGETSGKKVVTIKINTGNNAVNTLIKNPGNWDSSIFFGIKVANGVQGIFLSWVAKTGPAKTMAGIATTIPYIKVSPISAFNWLTNAAGEGCGGRNPWVTERAASIGIAT